MTYKGGQKVLSPNILDYNFSQVVQIKKSQTYLLGLSQNQMPQGSAFVNPTTD